MIPGIGLNADDVDILLHPTDFYHLLLRNIDRAQRRLVLRMGYRTFKYMQAVSRDTAGCNLFLAMK